MNKSSIRVLVVDDYEPWRRSLSTILAKERGLEIIGEASSGLEAIQKAKKLQPDLILLDIGLPTLNGIEAARRIREVSPTSKILFVSENRFADIAEEALSTGAAGYVLKSDAGRELLPAVKAVLEGKRFVSASLADRGLNGPPSQYLAGHARSDNVVPFTKQQSAGVNRYHEVEFYSDDDCFLDGFTRYIGAALLGGKAVIVVATESHRDSLLLRLQVHGLDIAAAIEEGRYIALDAGDTVSTFMVGGLPDPVQFRKITSDLVAVAAKAVNGETARVVACGECAPLLWTQGNMEAAIRVEHLWDDIAITQKVDIFCGYSLNSFQGGVGSYAFEKICSAHSAVHSR